MDSLISHRLCSSNVTVLRKKIHHGKVYNWRLKEDERLGFSNTFFSVGGERDWSNKQSGVI
ncbi:hypothetical protein Taro_048062 [Colocasia esculenta]|uniref:Uncharacterized protein n=1 Tax=Colocasia esculenta TaxID=4460 RepID=A0A843X7M6_COLES|nr:hypothetical protein [Colocasia esculenta]